MTRPWQLYHDLVECRYDLIEEGYDIELFHASLDFQAVRDHAFGVISSHLDSIKVHSLIVEKVKTGPALYPVKKFYPRMLGYLIRYVVERLPKSHEAIIITDRIPVNKKRNAVAKAVKLVLSDMLPADASRRVLHHDSKSSIGLQIADYCTWAIHR